MIRLNREIRNILDAHPIFPTDNGIGRQFFADKLFIGVEDKDVGELKSLALMDGHELDSILRNCLGNIGQVVLVFQDLINHGDKARQSLETRTFEVICPKGQGIEIGLPLGTIWQGTHIIIVVAILVNLPKQVIERMRLGIVTPGIQCLHKASEFLS